MQPNVLSYQTELSHCIFQQSNTASNIIDVGAAQLVLCGTANGKDESHRYPIPQLYK